MRPGQEQDDSEHRAGHQGKGELHRSAEEERQRQKQYAQNDRRASSACTESDVSRHAAGAVAHRDTAKHAAARDSLRPLEIANGVLGHAADRGRDDCSPHESKQSTALPRVRGSCGSASNKRADNRISCQVMARGREAGRMRKHQSFTKAQRVQNVRTLERRRTIRQKASSRNIGWKSPVRKEQIARFRSDRRQR